MSVSTECSFQTESDWDPQYESTSMVSFDMNQPGSPTSPSKFYKVGFISFSQFVCVCARKCFFWACENVFWGSCCMCLQVRYLQKRFMAAVKNNFKSFKTPAFTK